MTSRVSRVGLAAAGTPLALIIVACTASGAGSSPKDLHPLPRKAGRCLLRFASVAAPPTWLGSDGSGTAVVTVNGRVCHLDVPDAVAVKTMVDNSHAYLEITDKSGKTRRIDCRS